MQYFRIFRHYIPGSFLMLGLLEVLVFFLSFYAGVYLRFSGEAQSVAEHFGPLEMKALTYSAVMIVSMVAFGLYDRASWFLDGYANMLLRVVACFLFSIFPLSVLFYLAPETSLWRGATLLVLALSLLGIIGVRAFFLKMVDHRIFKRRALVLGNGKRARSVKKLHGHAQMMGVDVVGYIQVGEDEVKVDDRAVILYDRPLREIVKEGRVDEIVLAVDDRRKGMPVTELLDCKMEGVDVIDLLTFFERETGKINLALMNPSWLFLSDGFRVSTFRLITKRVFDVMVSLLLLPIFLPVMALVAAAVWFECRGMEPVIYKQVRVGEGNKNFTIYKFRSMGANAEGDGVARWAKKDDMRVTRVGKFIRKVRLDELPQIFNILKGDMSFVGPRPERPEFVRELEKDHSYYRERHRVKPGLTGWAQVCYQYGDSMEDAYEKLEYDLYYVKNYSIFIDLLIIVQTIRVVIAGQGAH
ncbi:TIGR03013 family PEP-CTERM/XrtA system glycosyltransferase [Gammaproteobacteria bacterium]|nr:TIGR03013 family PEP-CTERM/XrtA system glycosyltransferase [Gammaproteobacteria bacterium]